MKQELSLDLLITLRKEKVSESNLAIPGKTKVVTFGWKLLLTKGKKEIDRLIDR
jgi:hypothetical protein